VAAAPPELLNGLEVSGLRKSFDGTPAVHDLHLVAAPGAFLALLGPSGCGKTTTLRLIAGFERPDAGEIRINGRDVRTLPPHRRDIGIVFQSYALFPHKTVFENIAYGLVRRRVVRPELHARVRDAIDLVRLNGLEQRYPRQLSGGQQQRVALARAIVIRPSLLLFDEPLSNLDAKLRLNMRSEVRRLQRHLGITTVFVTHDQEEALSMADQVAVMNHGVLEQVGSPQDIYTRPANLFVAGFIGQATLLPVTVLSAAAGVVRLQYGSTVLQMTPCDPSMRPGTRGTLVLRAEDIRLIGDDDPAAGLINVVEGLVRESTYLGAVRQYRVTGASDADLMLQLPGNSGDLLREGQSVRIGWHESAGSFCADGPPP
jgi:spermidine/putrescine ABC transporter ATP-binding subunit